MDTRSEASEHAPKVKLRFIQPTRGLKVQENLGGGISFSPQFYLTNDRTRIAKLIDPGITVGMGLHFTDDTLRSEAVFYLEDDVSQADYDRGLFGVDEFVHYCMEFLLSVWTVKDHAIDLLPAILKISPPGKNPTHQVHSFGQLNFNASGKSDPIEFSLEEIRIACKYNQDWVQKLTRQSGPKTISAAPSQAQTNFQSGSSRLFRFLCLLDRARTIPDLGVKIGLLCGGMESIFSSGSSEITHRVGERVAFFLEADGEKRKQVYDRVTEAYGIRSAVLHGDQIGKEKLPKLSDVCVQTEEILRQSFRKIILDPDKFRLFTDPKCEKDIKTTFTGCITPI